MGGMGFKDLVKFNEAMLAKQVWRLLTDDSSLYYRVFKAKYFSNGSVFEAKVALGSYAWRSILKARGLIQRGCYGVWVMVEILISMPIGGCLARGL